MKTDVKYDTRPPKKTDRVLRVIFNVERPNLLTRLFTGLPANPDLYDLGRQALSLLSTGDNPWFVKRMLEVVGLKAKRSMVISSGGHVLLVRCKVSAPLVRRPRSVELDEFPHDRYIMLGCRGCDVTTHELLGRSGFDMIPFFEEDQGGEMLAYRIIN